MYAPNDHELVEAYLKGSEEAFATLVERHIGLVYSSALRQVADAHVAEEVTQAVFVLLAQKARNLHRETVLAGWLCQAARLTAYNFLKAEFRRRKREQEAQVDSPLNEPEPESWSEIMPLLDQAVAELAKTDRDALVLRFYQRKPLEEVGRILGLTADAAQKRVSRALLKLRKFFSVHGVVLTTAAIAGSISANAVQAAPLGLASTVTVSATKAAFGTAGIGIGAKAMGWLGKAISLPAALLPIIGSLPSLVLMALVGRSERNNYCDPQGFRSKLHQGFFRSFLWGFPVLAFAMGIVNQFVAGLWGPVGVQWFVAGLCFLLAMVSARFLTIALNRYYAFMFLYVVLLTAASWALALGWMSQATSQLIFWLGALVVLIQLKHRPLRMDYNLFLRAAKGILKEGWRAQVRGESEDAFNRASLFRFARFLGSRFLVNNFRWDIAGLVLRLPPVASGFLGNVSSALSPWMGRACSTVLLRWNGSVHANCGASDARELVALEGRLSPGRDELEKRVAEAVEQAWRCYRRGEVDEAEVRLGYTAESEVFVTPPAEATSTRWIQAFLGVLILAGVTLTALPAWLPGWLSRFKPVNVTESEVRKFLDDPVPNRDPEKFRNNSAALALFSCTVLPSTNLFSPRALQAMRDEIAGSFDFTSVRTKLWRVQWAFNTPLPRAALGRGWLDLGDLDLKPADARHFLLSDRPDLYSDADFLFTRRQAWSWLGHERNDVMRIDRDGFGRLQLLRMLSALEIVPTGELANQIASVQVLSGRRVGQPRIGNWRAVRGLFVTPGYPALHDTYFSLAALEILGALGRIDRPACVQGILRRHKGKGFFTSPEPGGFNEFHIDGGARDTVAAFESLRILGALDRVKDLDQWEFRVRTKKSADSGLNQMTWEKVEAWVCTQRLKEILDKHKQDPRTPFSSLLEAQPF